MEGTMAVVTCFAADFAPKNWALCNGQLIAIAQNQALFALLGTTYGGNGNTTFALPNLQGMTPVSTGQGPGLSNYNLGQVGGNETLTLVPNNLPPHTHNGNVTLQLQANGEDGTDPTPNDGWPSRFTNAYSPNNPDSTMLPPNFNLTVGVGGASQPIPIRPPFLAINYIICMYGIFPSRN